jgi:hypothetical protein
MNNFAANKIPEAWRNNRPLASPQEWPVRHPKNLGEMWTMIPIEKHYDTGML